MSDQKHFVYVRTMLGPSPQIWHGDLTDGMNQSKEVICRWKISGEEAELPPRMLAKMYPCPAQEEAA
jgi:hypothetical protein